MRDMQTKPRADENTENIIFTIGDVKITNKNAVFRERVYLISDITSANSTQPLPIAVAIIAPIMILLGSIVICVSLVFSINFDLAGYAVLGLLLIGCAIYLLLPTYRVEIGIINEKVEVYSSKNSSRCKTIVDALNKAIENRKAFSTREHDQSPI